MRYLSILLVVSTGIIGAMEDSTDTKPGRVSTDRFREVLAQVALLEGSKAEDFFTVCRKWRIPSSPSPVAGLLKWAEDNCGRVEMESVLGTTLEKETGSDE